MASELRKSEVTGEPFSYITLGMNFIFEGFVSDRASVAAAIMDAIKHQVEEAKLVGDHDQAITRQVQLRLPGIELTHKF